jgi:hypothetical protein
MDAKYIDMGRSLQGWIHGVPGKALLAAVTVN